MAENETPFCREWRIFRCGCVQTAEWSKPHEMSSLTIRTCSECFDTLDTRLDQLSIDELAQLTIPLPSRDGRPGGNYA